MAILEGNLFGCHTCRPSALVPYIMAWVNPGPQDGFQVEWASIVGSTPWLTAQEHISEQKLQWFDEPAPEMPSDLELATEDMWCCITE